MMLSAFSISPLHFIGQDDRNEVQQDISCYVMLLALVLASHDTVSILYVTINIFLGQNITN